MKTKKFGMLETGFIFPVFSDFKKLLEDELKAQFGDDFKINTNTSLGQILEAFAWKYEGFSNILKSLYSNLFLFDTRGVALDRYGANYSIYRLLGRKAYGEIEITGEPNYLILDGFEVISEDNLFYVLNGNVLLDDQGVGIGQVVAAEVGSEYNCDIGYINTKGTGDENVKEVTNITNISNGDDVESDIDYQLRIHHIKLGSGTATTDNVKNALLKLEEVSYCNVYENDTMIYDPTYDLPSGTIRIVVLGIINQNVANTIFDTKAAGIPTFGNVFYEVKSKSNQIVEIKIQRANTKELYIKISDLEINTNVTLEEIKRGINKNIEQYMLSMSLGRKLNYEKILAAVYMINSIEEANVEISIDGINYFKSDITTQYDEFIEYNESKVEYV